MTAAATTGPAKQPRPTSSTPAICWMPVCQKMFSCLKVGLVVFFIAMVWIIGEIFLLL